MRIIAHDGLFNAPADTSVVYYAKEDSTITCACQGVEYVLKDGVAAEEGKKTLNEFQRQLALGKPYYQF